SPDTTSSPGSPTDGTQNATAGSGPSDSLLAATIGPIKALTAKPRGVVRVPVTCPAIQLSGCTGTIVIAPLASSAHKRDKPARGIKGRHRQVVRVCQALAFTALAGFALHAAVGFGGHGLDGFFTNWVYNGLIVASAAGCLARALLVRQERAAWLALAFGLVAW